MPERKVLAKRVRAFRKAKKESQCKFSEHTGVSEDEISRIEREIANPALGTVQKLAAYMGNTVAELLAVEGDGPKYE